MTIFLITSMILVGAATLGSVMLFVRFSMSQRKTRPDLRALKLEDANRFVFVGTDGVYSAHSFLTMAVKEQKAFAGVISVSRSDRRVCPVAGTTHYQTYGAAVT